MGLTINPSYDASMSGAPAGFGVNIGYLQQWAAEKYLAPNAPTLNVQFGWGTLNGNPMYAEATAENIGVGGYYGNGLFVYSWANTVSPFLTEMLTALGLTAALPLNPQMPDGTDNCWMPQGLAKAYGLPSTDVTGHSWGPIDVYVALNPAVAALFDWNRAESPSGKYCVIAMLKHEFSEGGLGRGMCGFAQNGGAGPVLCGVADNFRYVGPGGMCPPTQYGGYLSSNKGVTNYGTFAATAPDDPGDFVAGGDVAATDPFLANTPSPGKVELSNSDQIFMYCLGINLEIG